MMLFGLSILFVLSLSLYVAKSSGQDVTITFLVLLILFSGLTYKRHVKNELKMMNVSVEVSCLHSTGLDVMLPTTATSTPT